MYAENSGTAQSPEQRSGIPPTEKAQAKTPALFLWSGGSPMGLDCAVPRRLFDILNSRGS